MPERTRTIGADTYDPVSSTTFSEYDIFEIEFRPIAGLSCIADLGG